MNGPRGTDWSLNSRPFCGAHSRSPIDLLPRPSINKNLQNVFFFRQELNPNSRISAARPSMDVHLPARRRSASSFPHPSQSICWPRPSSFMNFLIWFFSRRHQPWRARRRDRSRRPPVQVSSIVLSNFLFYFLPYLLAHLHTMDVA